MKVEALLVNVFIKVARVLKKLYIDFRTNFLSLKKKEVIHICVDGYVSRKEIIGNRSWSRFSIFHK